MKLQRAVSVLIVLLLAACTQSTDRDVLELNRTGVGYLKHVIQAEMQYIDKELVRI